MRRRTFAKRALIHWDFVRETLRRARRSVLEVGVGSGAQSALLSRFRRVVALDNDDRILSAARPNLERFGRRPILVRGDGFALPLRSGSVDVAISQGLMEHFSDSAVASLLREQLRVASSVVFSVPSDNYPHRDVGDERLLPPEQWQRIVKEAVEPGLHRVRARYVRGDLESAKHSLLRRRRLGPLAVLVCIDPVGKG